MGYFTHHRTLARAPSQPALPASITGGTLEVIAGSIAGARCKVP